MHWCCLLSSGSPVCDCEQVAIALELRKRVHYVDVNVCKTTCWLRVFAGWILMWHCVLLHRHVWQVSADSRISFSMECQTNLLLISFMVDLIEV